MADISRADALALIREQNGNEIWQAAVEFSAALRTFRKVNLGTKIAKYPVMGALPTAGFVSGEDADDANSVKPTTNMAFSDRTMTAEEIAGIVVIPENVLEDSSNDFDIWAEIKPRIAEAVGATLDGAVFFGTNAPASWPTGLVPAAITAGNVVQEGDSLPDGPSGAGLNDLAADLDATAGMVEDDGYEASVVYGRRSLGRRVRGLRDSQNSPIYTLLTNQTGQRVAVIGESEYVRVTNGAWDTAQATALFGDPRYALLGIRQDLTYKFLDQATVTIGGTLISLAERDLVALRFKMRVGFQTAQVATLEGGSTAYPFAVLQPAGS